MTAKPLKIAIVGCGQFGEEHVKEISKIAEANIIAVCDKEELLAQQLAERYGIPSYYNSLEALYADVTPDVVHITTPPQTHFQLGKFACEHGSHIYMEKPFTINYGEAVQLINIAESFERKVTVGHIYHFDPPILKMRELVAQGVLGSPVHIEALMGYSLESPFAKAFLNDRNHWLYGLPGQLFQNIISHLIYKVVEFLPEGKPFVSVYCTRRNEMLKKKQISLMDELRVILVVQEVTAYITFSSTLSPGHSVLRIYGTKDSIEVDLNSRIVIVRRGKQLPTVIGKMFTGIDLALQYLQCVWMNFIAFVKSDYHFLAGMDYLIQSFYASIWNNSAPPIGYPEILRTTLIMDLIFAQLKKFKLPHLENEK